MTRLIVPFFSFCERAYKHCQSVQGYGGVEILAIVKKLRGIVLRDDADSTIV